MEGIAARQDRETGLWWLLGAAAVLLLLRVSSNGFVPGIAHDSFQYFSVAEQALRGRIGETGIVHFDAERSFGRVPAPLVTFPLGYPALVALMRLTGASPMHAAMAVNFLAALACIALTWWLIGQLGARRGVRVAIVACLVVNGAFLHFAATASTEMTFTAVFVGAVALAWRARQRPDSLVGWVVTGVAFGAAYHVRYAGLFLIVGLFVISARAVLMRHRALAVGHAVAAATACLMVSIGMLRNVLLVGNWRGGNEKVVSNAVGDLLYQSVRAVNGIVLGLWGTAPRLSLALRILFLLCAVIAVGHLWQTRHRHAPTVPTPVDVREFTLDIVLLIGTYAALMFYAGLTTVISYGARMFVPVIPLLAVLLAIAVNRWLPPAQGTLMRRAPALAAAMGLYLIVNAISYANPLVDRATVVRSQLAGRTSAGPSIGDLIEATGRGVVVANSGQALGFLLDRPTVSLVGPHYSNIEWDEAALREVVSRYAASVVVMTGPSDAQPLSTDLIPSAFIGSLTRGEAPPWLRVVGRSGPVTVYVPLASP